VTVKLTSVMILAAISPTVWPLSLADSAMKALDGSSVRPVAAHERTDRTDRTLNDETFVLWRSVRHSPIVPLAGSIQGPLSTRLSPHSPNY
jgi:hypothetical protein